MNSGSEYDSRNEYLMSTLRMTGPGRKEKTRMVAIERAFHGRTDRPAQISHSCKDGYDKNLNTFQDRDNLVLIPANDISALRKPKQADVDGVFIEL